MTTRKNRKPDTEVRRIRRPIDDERRSQLAYKMAHVTKQLDHERDEKASEMKMFNEHIKELTQRMSQLASDVEEGMEDLEIEVIVVKSFETNTVYYYAIDHKPGDEPLDTRVLQPEEREKLEQVTIDEVTGGED